MNKCICAFTAAAIAASALIATPAAATPQDNAKIINWVKDKESKRATWEDMNIPNANGVVLVARYPASVTACTKDNYLVYGDIYAAALPAEAEHIAPHSEVPFLSKIQDSFIKSVNALPATEITQHMTPHISMPPSVLQSMRDAATAYNQQNKDKSAPIKWMMFKYQITSAPNNYCLSNRGAKL
jgi:hypothetical protein